MILLTALVGAGILLRVFFLNSDPSYYLWSGYITDEGRWTELAREYALFGSPDADSWFSRVHILLAPAYQLYAGVVFVLGGVSFFTARLTSVIAGIALLAAVVIFLRKRTSPEGLLAATAVFALQPDLLFFSRVAIPEMSAMFFEFVAFALAVSGPRTAKRAFAAGVVSLAAVAFKATVAPIVLILAIATVLAGERDDPASGIRRFASYCAGVLGPVMLPALFWVALNGGLGVPVALIVELASGFTRLNTPYVALSNLFYNPIVPALTVLLLPAWVIAVSLFAHGRFPSIPARAVYIASGLWTAGWLVGSSLFEYFPQRYLVHVLVPLAVNFAAGLTIIQETGVRATVGESVRGAGWRGRVARLGASVPQAVLLATFALGVLGLIGVDPAQFRWKIGLVCVISLLGGVLPSRAFDNERFTFLFVGLPMVFAPLWLLASWVGFGAPFWDAGLDANLSKAALMTISGVVAVAAHGVLGRRWTPHLATMTYVVTLGAIWFLQFGPKYLQPTYTILNAARTLSTIADNPGEVVGTHVASGVFLGTQLRYREGLPEDSLPTVATSARRRLSPSLRDKYVLVRSVSLHIDDRFLKAHPAEDPYFRVYVRSDQDGNARTALPSPQNAN